MTASSRVSRLQHGMEAAGVDVSLFSTGPDLFYLTGYQTVPSERLTMLMVPVEGEPTLFVPRLEAPRVPGDIADLVVWGEHEDPVQLVAAHCRRATRIAIGDHTWAVFLVGLLGRLGGVSWLAASELTRSLRSVKEPQEVNALRRAGAAVDRVLERIPDEVRFGGRTESGVAADLRSMIVEEGHQTADFAIVAGGPNGASPHHDPGDRVLVQGDLVVCDFGGTWDGYHSDVTRTFVVGEPSGEALEVHGVVEAANRAGRGTVRPGVACEEIDRAARRVVAEAGYGEHFLHRTGHGIGLEVHEHPYMVEGNTEELVQGMVFSVEPGIYLPGRLGVRIEDIVVCGDNGADELNTANRDLVPVG